MTPDKQSLLRLHPVSRGMSHSDLDRIAYKLTVRTYAAKEVVFNKGEMPEHLYLVIGGRFRMTSDVNATDRIANFGPGDQIGLLPLLHEEPSTVAVLADEPSMVLEISPRDVFVFMRRHPLLARNLLRTAPVCFVLRLSTRIILLQRVGMALSAGTKLTCTSAMVKDEPFYSVAMVSRGPG